MSSATPPEPTVLLDITIDALPPSQNQMLRMHWAKYHRHLNDWYFLLGNTCHPRQKAKVKVRIDFTHPGPQADDDNATARCKVVLDALKQRWWIWDDGPRHIDLKATDKGGKKSSTRIRITGPSLPTESGRTRRGGRKATRVA